MATVSYSWLQLTELRADRTPDDSGTHDSSTRERQDGMRRLLPHGLLGFSAVRHLRGRAVLLHGLLQHQLVDRLMCGGSASRDSLSKLHVGKMFME